MFTDEEIKFRLIKVNEIYKSSVLTETPILTLITDEHDYIKYVKKLLYFLVDYNIATDSDVYVRISDFVNEFECKKIAEALQIIEDDIRSFSTELSNTYDDLIMHSDKLYKLLNKSIVTDEIDRVAIMKESKLFENDMNNIIREVGATHDLDFLNKRCNK